MLPPPAPICPLENAVPTGAPKAVFALIHAAQGGARGGVEANLPQVVQDPRGHELDVGLRAFLLDEALELVVAVTLRGHGPELTDDRHLGLRHRAIDLDRLEDLLGP